MRIERTGALVLAAALALGGCQDLNVPNENNPDRERSLVEPAAVEALARAVFPIWMDVTQNDGVSRLIAPAVADEMTTDDSYDGRCNPILQIATEPRQPLNNDPVTCPADWPENNWDDLHEMISNTIEVLRSTEINGIEIVVDGEDITEQVRAWAKLWQGVGTGKVGLLFDRGWVATEDTPAEAIENADEMLTLVEYPDLIAGAVDMLQEAADMALSMEPFEIPAEWAVTEQPMNNERLAQVAHSFIARFMTLAPRTAEERENVDWAAVLSHLDQGITDDLSVITTNSSDERSVYLLYLQRDGNGDQFRADYNLIGPGDISGNYQAWYNAPFEQQFRFLITTPDRRITGETDDPTSDGLYYRYLEDHPFDETQGPYLGSYYQWFRFEGQWRRGFELKYLTMQEMQLNRAEALIRSGIDVQGGVDILNETRVGNGALPELTVDGVPESEDCVPRDPETGACGTLIQALEWERRMELVGINFHFTYFDRRGFDTHSSGTLLHLPIPAEQVEVLPNSIPGGVYTFGGNLPWSAQ